MHLLLVKNSLTPWAIVFASGKIESWKQKINNIIHKKCINHKYFDFKHYTYIYILYLEYIIFKNNLKRLFFFLF